MPTDAPIPLPAAPLIVTAASRRWPAGIEELPSRPQRLIIAGELPSLERAVAIVGTRAADEEAVDFTRQLARSLGASGCAIVSGGALGIDAAAHRGALEQGAPTVAVLATGLRSAYPREHARLFARIASRGALVSEFDHAPARPGYFLKRNRIVAALAKVVVVVQAPLRSGALSTARWAVRLKRPVFAVPGSPWDIRAAGCLSLLGLGARPCASATDILSALSLQQDPASSPRLAAGRPSAGASGPSDRRRTAAQGRDSEVPQQKKRSGGCREGSGQRLPGLQSVVLKQLEVRPLHPDEIARRTGLSAAEVLRTLLELTLLGTVEQVAAGGYRRTEPGPPIAASTV